MPTLYHHIYGFSIFNTLTEVLHEIVSIIQVIPSFFVFNKPLEIPSYIPLFSQCSLWPASGLKNVKKKTHPGLELTLCATSASYQPPLLYIL